MTPLLAWIGGRLVARRRARYRGRAVPLTEPVRDALAPYFPRATLDVARIATVPRIPGPPFAGCLRRLGLGLADFDRVVGITYQDTILVAERLRGPALLATLFHELVHVEQARQLGPSGFLRRYIGEWLRAGGYDAIPLERDAYALQRRFESPREGPFDAAAAVTVRLAPLGGEGTLV